MLPSLGDLFLFVVAFAVPLVIVLALMPSYIQFLISKGRVVPDAHKPKSDPVPTPAGPLLILAIIAGEFAIYAINRSSIPVAAVAVVVVAGAVGLYDDIWGLGGVVKPALLTLAAVPLIFLERIHESLYSAQLYFPLFGATGTHYIIFAILLVAAMPVASNAFNMLDAFNGEIAGFTALTSVALIIAILFRAADTASYNYTRLAAVLPLTAVALSFYYFNRYPSRIFDGDSGSLTFGVLFATLAIMGGVEIAALVAAIPAVLNSYFIIYSIKGFVEHKKIAARPTYLGEDGKLHSSDELGAPTTLVKMLVSREPLGERELVKGVFTLTAYSCLLAVLTAAMTWVP